MGYWLRLDYELAGARAENGMIHPDALESGLSRRGIFKLENREAARLMLGYIARGRNEAMAEKIEPEKPNHR